MKVQALVYPILVAAILMANIVTTDAAFEEGTAGRKVLCGKKEVCPLADKLEEVWDNIFPIFPLKGRAKRLERRAARRGEGALTEVEDVVEVEESSIEEMNGSNDDSSFGDITVEEEEEEEVVVDEQVDADIIAPPTEPIAVSAPVKDEKVNGNEGIGKNVAIVGVAGAVFGIILAAAMIISAAMMLRRKQKTAEPKVEEKLQELV